MSVIQRKELITDEAFNWPEKYKKDLEEIIATSKKLGQPKNQPKVPGSDPKTRKNLDELAKVQNLLAKATEKSSKEFLGQKAALDKLNKENRESVKTINAQTSAYDKLDNELTSTRKAYKDLAAAGKENTTQAKKLLAQTKKLDTQLKKIDNTVGQNQRSVGKYSNALKGVTARFLGWAAVATILFRALKGGITIVKQYVKANSTLNAILDKTRKETKALREQQEALGKSTAFSATQVTKAQTELARLGLTMAEIKSLTPAILDAAVAFGVDMAQAAELVAGQLNAFNLAASEGQRVSDVLTRATQISAFTYQRLFDALKVVSPAADAVGVSIEQTIGILTAAVDANIDAGTASTALRNIFIELERKGLTWSQAMTKINTSTNRLSEANELFGKRGAVVATVIANNTTKIDINTKALFAAEGAAKAFAKAQLDNLTGDQLLLTSAWEGFIIALEDGEGVLSRISRTTIQLFTAALGALGRATSGTTLEFELWKERIEGAKLSNEDLNQTLGRVIKKINEENEALAGLKSTSARSAADERIESLQKQKDFLLEIGQQRTQAIQDQIDKEKKAEDERVRLQQEANAKILASRKQLQKALSLLNADTIFDSKKTFLEEVAAKKETNDTIKRIEEKLANDLKSINKRVTDDNKAAADERVRIAKEEAKEKAKIDKIAAEAKQAFIDLEFELATELGRSFTNQRIQQLSQELEFNEFVRDRELEKFEGNERKQFEINRQFDAKRRELQRKQVITERANALFQILINTAVAVTRISAEAALAAPFLIPGIIALGAIQAAAVLAAPIPQFDEGKERTPSDYIAGEKRPELRKSRGKWSLIDKPTLFKDSPGDKIVSGKETDSILGTMTDLTGKNMLTDPGLMLGLLNNDFSKKKSEADLSYIIKKGDAEIVRAIKNQKLLDIRVNTARAFVTEINGQTRIDYINQTFRS